MLIWAVLVFFGLGALFTAHPALVTLLTFAGGGYLIRLFVWALRPSWQGRAADIRLDDRKRSAARSWRYGLFVVLTNPKDVLMWAAVSTFLFGHGLQTWQVAAFGPVGATSGFFIYGSYALLVSTVLPGRSTAASPAMSKRSSGSPSVVSGLAGCRWHP